MGSLMNFIPYKLLLQLSFSLKQGTSYTVQATWLNSNHLYVCMDFLPAYECGLMACQKWNLVTFFLRHITYWLRKHSRFTLLHGGETSLRSHHSLCYSVISQIFMPPDCSLPCPQPLASGHYSESQQSSPHHAIYKFYYPVSIVAFFLSAFHQISICNQLMPVHSMNLTHPFLSGDEK
jgi:hypothetical protein